MGDQGASSVLTGRGGYASGFGDFPDSAEALLRPTTKDVQVFDYSQVSVTSSAPIQLPPGTGKMPATSFRPPVIPSIGQAELNENFEHTRNIQSVDGSGVEFGLPTQPGVGQPVFTYKGTEPALNALRAKAALRPAGTRKQIRKHTCLGLQAVNSILGEQEFPYIPGRTAWYHIAQEAFNRIQDWNFEGFCKHFDLADHGLIYTIQSQGAQIMPAYFKREAIVDCHPTGEPIMGITATDSADTLLEGAIVGFQLQLTYADNYLIYQSSGASLGPTSFGHVGGHTITGSARMWRSRKNTMRCFFQLVPVAVYCAADIQDNVLFGVGGYAPFIEAGVVTRAAPYQVDLQSEFTVSDANWTMACTRPQIEVDTRTY